jgi:hypothetical protein
MRHVFLLAVSAIALSSAPLSQASAGAAASLSNAADELRLAQPVAHVCREVCRENFCRTRCFEERDRDEVVHERFYRDRDRDHDRDHRDHDRDHRRAFEFDAPGVSIRAH